MQTSVYTSGEDGRFESSRSGVFWSAIIGGAVGATALTLALMVLGTGLGFAGASPWAHEGMSKDGMTVMTIIWIVITQWLSSALGGYLTGRLRTKWVGMHTDETFFRDTAHGFLSWALATVFVGLFAASTAATAINAGAENMDNGRYAHHAWRNHGRMMHERVGERPAPPAAAADEDVTADGDVAATETIAPRDQFTPAEKQHMDEARKAAMKIALFTFLAMLIGAFISSAAAALGGIHRDDYEEKYRVTTTRV